MKFFPLILYCGCVQSLPVTNQANVIQFAFEDGIENEDDSHYLEKKSVSDQCQNVLETEDHENYETPSRLSLPTLMTISSEDASPDLDVDKIVSEMIYQPGDFMLPSEIAPETLMTGLLPMNPRAPWRNMMDDLNYMQDSMYETSKVLPYQLPSYMPENIVPSLRSLPPVSMQIHESLMEIGDNYETGNDWEMDNGLYLTPSIRAVRSREEEFLEQLKHEGIPNIIPTMPVPFVRTASPVYQAGQDAPLMMFLFPGKVSDCALPFLLGCSPKIAYGRLAQTSYDSYPLPTAVPNADYRREPDTMKNHEVKQVLSKVGT